MNRLGYIERHRGLSTHAPKPMAHNGAAVTAIARSMELDVRRSGRDDSLKIVVAGPDGAALDRYEAKFGELAPLLDALVTEVMRAVVKQHTGVEFRAP